MLTRAVRGLAAIAVAAAGACRLPDEVEVGYTRGQIQGETILEDGGLGDVFGERPDLVAGSDFDAEALSFSFSWLIGAPSPRATARQLERIERELRRVARLLEERR